MKSETGATLPAQHHVLLHAVAGRRLEDHADPVGFVVELPRDARVVAGVCRDPREGDGVARVQGRQPLRGDPLRLAAGADERAAAVRRPGSSMRVRRAARVDHVRGLVRALHVEQLAAAQPVRALGLGCSRCGEDERRLLDGAAALPPGRSQTAQRLAAPASSAAGSRSGA